MKKLIYIFLIIFLSAPIISFADDPIGVGKNCSTIFCFHKMTKQEMQKWTKDTSLMAKTDTIRCGDTIAIKKINNLKAMGAYRAIEFYASGRSSCAPLDSWKHIKVIKTLYDGKVSLAEYEQNTTEVNEETDQKTSTYGTAKAYFLSSDLFSLKKFKKKLIKDDD